MPTFNRNDTNAILAFFGQTSTGGSTQPRDEEYYTSNDPPRPSSNNRPRPSSSNVVTPTTTRRPTTVPRDEAYYTSQPLPKPKQPVRPPAPKVKRNVVTPIDTTTFNANLNQWRNSNQAAKPITPLRPRTPVQGPQPRPEPNFIQRGVDQWQAPRRTNVVQPFQGYDVTPTNVDYARPTVNTGTNPFSGQQQRPPTVGSPTDLVYGYPMPRGSDWTDIKPQGPEDWLTSRVGEWVAKPLGNFGAAVGNWTSDFGRDVGTLGPVDAVLNQFEGTPGYDYAVKTYEQRQAEGSNEGFNRWKDNFWTSMAVLQVPQKAIETGKIPGTNVSMGELGAAAGKTINQTINPFLPERVQMDLGKLATQGPLSPLQAPFNIAYNIFTDTLAKSQKARAYLEALPEAQREEANVALTALTSGGDRVIKTVDSIINQDATVANLVQKAEAKKAELEAFLSSRPNTQFLNKQETAYANAIAYEAAEYGRQAEELRKKTAIDFVDENVNVWAELAGGIFLDPLNYITLGPSKEALEAMRTARLMNVPEKEAVALLTKVMDGKPIPTLWQELVGENTAKWLGYVNPFKLLERTPDTQAHKATSDLFRAAAQLLTDVTDKETARAVISTWATNPRLLVEGIRTPSGIYKVGGGVVANAELLPHYNVLKQAGEALLNLDVLKGTGGFNPVEVYAKLEDIFYKAARQVNGLEVLPELPGGAMRARLRKTAAGSAVVEYLDKAGKVLSTSEEMVAYDAELLIKNIRKAAAGAGSRPAGNPLLQTWGVQKAILSDMYLGMSPGYWIKNGLSATAHLIADNTYTLLPTKNMLGRLSSWYGVAPTTSLFNAAQGITGGGAADTALQGGVHWLERIIGKNPYSKMMNALYKIPYGNYALARGRVPISEENFRLRAAFVPMERYITAKWGQATDAFADGLETMGLDRNVVRALAGIARDTGINGNKAAVVKAIRENVVKRTLPVSLKDLGVPDELISAEGWKAITDTLTSYTPDQAGEAAAEIARIFKQELLQPAELLNSAPPQPSRALFSEVESLQDNAGMIDGLIDSAKRAGADPNAAKQQGQQIAQQITQAEQTLWKTLRDDVAQSDSPTAPLVALDVLVRWYDWRTAARRAVDEASKRAVELNTPAAWAEKGRITAETYGAFEQFFAGVIDEARAGLLSGQAKGYDWFDVIRRYSEYDEEAIQAARTAGMALGSPQARQTQWQQTIDAGRQYIDQTFVELFSAFRRYPTQDALDLVADGIRKVEQMGAQTAHAVAVKKAELLPRSADAFYKFRNQAWAQFFDNGAVLNRVTQRLVVAQGIAQTVASGLRWVDDFAGGEFQLVGRSTDGFWEALNTATREVTRFADPKNTQAGLPSVPQQVISDFMTAIGQVEPMIDNVLAELNQESLTMQTVKGIAPDVEKLLRKGDAVSALPAEAKAAPLAAAQGSQVTLTDGRKATVLKVGEWQKAGTAGEGYTYTLQLEDGRTIYGFRNPWGNDIRPIDMPPGAPPSAGREVFPPPVAPTTPPPTASTRITRAEADDLRRLANDAGIQTATEDGKPMGRRLLNTLNKDLGLKLKRIEDLPPERLPDAVAALEARKAPAAPAVAQPAPVVDAAAEEAMYAEEVKRLGLDTETEADPAAAWRAQVEADKKPRPPVQQAPVSNLRRRIADAANVLPTGQRIEFADFAKNFTDEEWPQVYEELRRMQDAGDVVLIPLSGEVGRGGSVSESTWKYARPVLGGETPKQIDWENLPDYRMAFYREKNLAPGLSTPFIPTPPTTDMGMGIVPFDMLGWLSDAEVRRQTSEGLYTISQGLLDFFGLGKKGGNLYKLIRGLNENAASTALHKAPEVGEVAAHTLRTLADAEKRILQRLPEILAGRPNTLTPAQQVRVMDALNKMLPEYDNILAGAARVGEKMGDWSMLNYNDKRYIDAMLGFTFGYHYYWSRTGLNWMQRTMNKPGILNLWYETQRAVERENQQANVPEHLQGTLPGPGGRRIGNPLTWLMPFASYMGNEFVNPDEAKTDADRWLMNVQKYTPGLMPILSYALAYQQDQTSPLPNGKKRTGSYQAGDYLPLYRLGGYAYQAQTGNMGPQGFLAFGDEYDYGRAGKQVALQGMEAGADPGKQAWALDVGYQQQQGLDALPEQPAGVDKLWQQGAQAAGAERFLNRAGAFFLATPNYSLSPEEQQMRAMKEERIGLGYDPVTNPYGSRAAVWERTGQDGDVWDAGFNYSALYPGMGPRTRPGVAAATNDYWNTVNPTFDRMNQGAADFVTKNPEATTAEMSDFKQPFFDEVMGLSDEFPSVPNKVGEREGLPPRNTRYMNPQEEARYEVGRMMAYELPGKPEYPGDDAAPDVMRAYYKEKATYEKARLDRVDQLLNRFLVEKFESNAPWIPIARSLVKGEYASELLRMYENRNATDVERHWNDRQTFVEEVEAAEWKRREQAVIDRLGEDGITALQTYLDLEKGDPRSQYKEENPLASMALFAAFNPNDYDTFVQKYGEKGLDIAYKTQLPEHPGDGASEAQLKQYYTLRDAYNKKYPEAEEVRLWLWGRRFGAANGSDDYGLAHAEAVRIFGPDIFTIVNSFPSGGTKQEIARWYDTHAREAELRSGYFEWKREYNEEDRATLDQEPEEEAKISNAGAGQGYIGPRPVGEAYVPVGQNQWWDANAPTPTEQLQQGPSLLQQGQRPMGPLTRWEQLSQDLYGAGGVNPWTQRAGELNAAKFQGATIPNKMGEGARSIPQSTKSAALYAAQADKNYRGGRRSGRRSYYSSRRRSSGGGGYRRSYGGGGGGGSYFANVQMPDARGLNSSLWSTDQIREWRPWNNTANDWLYAGKDIGPERLEEWQPLRR